jgi:hypothetical protein
MVSIYKARKDDLMSAKMFFRLCMATLFLTMFGMCSLTGVGFVTVFKTLFVGVA